MESKIFIKNYWNYYLELERQVLRISRYVDFNAQNNATYSIEFLQLFLSICSEIDVLAKVIVGESDEIKENSTINTWGAKLEQRMPEIVNYKVVFNDDYQVKPWERWHHEEYTTKKNQQKFRLREGCKNPTWWIEYNKVKHQRTTTTSGKSRTYYTRACLQNVINSLAALWVIETEYLNSLNTSNEMNIEYMKSKLFKY